MLEKLGWHIAHFPGKKHGWFVGLAPHGGSAPTLRGAIEKCLRCCDIGAARPERVREAMRAYAMLKMEEDSANDQV